MSPSALAESPAAARLRIPAPSDELAAREPAEARGVARDGVRLLVTSTHTGSIEHATFRDLPRFLHAGDVLVVNASATLPAALGAALEGGVRAEETVRVHLSTPLPGGSPRHWVIELRRPTDEGTAPLRDARPGDRLRFADGGRATLLEPYRPSAASPGPSVGAARAATEVVRLWVAELTLPGGVLPFAARHGEPIRYKYVPGSWSLAHYQTVFATEPGSAEMPSAGRPFTPALVEALQQKGVVVAPLVLHTGVSSLESDEPPYPERYRVPRETAAVVNAAREWGSRVVAVGTTAVRALETVTSPGGHVHAGSGWTDLVITPERGLRAVDAILTGLHEPTSSHLSMLAAFAGRGHLQAAYGAALRERYRWHEFGDVHLLRR